VSRHRKKRNAKGFFGDDVFVEENLIKDTSATTTQPQVAMKKLAL